MTSFILFLISIFLKCLICPFSYVYGIVRSLIKCQFNEYNFNLAISKYQYGNALCCYLFNDILITSNVYKFSNPYETIYSAIGKNRRKETLTLVGKTLDWILDNFKKNNSMLSIDETEDSVN